MSLNYNHRRLIYEKIKEAGITANRKEIEEAINECMVCKKKDKQILKTCKFIDVTEPGERFGIDMLEIDNKDRIRVGIDYFSRKLFAKATTTKESSKILQFLKEVYNELPFTCLVSDNGREFKNDEVKGWFSSKGIRHMYSVPYYHQSNGRIERTNRTIRNALKKTQGSTKKKLKDVIENYNGIVHRGIGVSPKEAIRQENWEKVREHTEKYKKEFEKKKHGKVIEYNIGDKVLIKNEMKSKKMEDEFGNQAVVVSKEYGDVYIVVLGDGKKRRKHVSQLKKI